MCPASPGGCAGVEGPGHPGILRGRAVAGGEEPEGPWAPSDHQKLQKSQSGQVPRFWVRPRHSHHHLPGLRKPAGAEGPGDHCPSLKEQNLSSQLGGDHRAAPAHPSPGKVSLRPQTGKAKPSPARGGKVAMLPLEEILCLIRNSALAEVHRLQGPEQWRQGRGQRGGGASNPKQPAKDR